MKRFYRLVCEFGRDERGGEVLEYALVAGMISVIAVGPITAVGAKVLNYWKSLDRSLGF